MPPPRTLFEASSQLAEMIRIKQAGRYEGAVVQIAPLLLDADLLRLQQVGQLLFAQELEREDPADFIHAALLRGTCGITVELFELLQVVDVAWLSLKFLAKLVLADSVFLKE